MINWPPTVQKASWWLKTLGLAGQVKLQLFHFLQISTNARFVSLENATTLWVWYLHLLLLDLAWDKVTLFFREQIFLPFPARVALTYFSGTRSELLISKHIKRTDSIVYWHSVKTFANSWQKSLPSGRREQKLGGEKNTMIQIVSISRPSLFS